MDDDLTLELFALALYAIYKGVKKLHETRTIFISPEPNLPTPQNVVEHNSQQADHMGWALTITKIGMIQYTCQFVLDVHNYNELEVRIISASIILSWLRDNHPNPDVADKSADLILTLRTTAHTLPE